MKLSIDGLYDGLIGMFLSGATQVGGSIVNAARADAAYAPYKERLKQLWESRQTPQEQEAQRTIQQTESGEQQIMQDQVDPLINSPDSKRDKMPDFDSLASQLIGIETSTGIKVEAISSHVVSRLAERGVSVEETTDALTAPLKTGKIREDKSQQFVGERVTVVINTDTGKIITTWRTHTKRAAALKGK